MSLGSEKLGRGKVKELGLAKGNEFKPDVYDRLHSMLYDDNNEVVAFVGDKYLAIAVKAFLEDLNFTCVVAELSNKNVVINKSEGIFEFRNKLDDKIKYELLYDWESFKQDIKDYVKENPIVKKEVGERNMENWNVPVEQQNSTQGDLIDQSVDKVKGMLKQVKDKFKLSDSDTERNAKDWVDNIYHEQNITKYLSKKNPDVKLLSGKYKNIQDLIVKNGWELQFEEDYEMEVFDYFNSNNTEGIESKFLNDVGFEYISEQIVVSNSTNWHLRNIEVKYKDQDKDVDDKENKVKSIIDSVE